MRQFQPAPPREIPPPSPLIPDSKSEPTLTFNTAASSASVDSSITEVYRDSTPPPSTKILPSDLSYAMTSQSSSHDSIFPPGTMALAQGQVVHIIASSIDKDTNITSYAVRAGNAIFITTSETLTAIPQLSTKSISTSSTTASTRSSWSKHLLGVNIMGKLRCNYQWLIWLWNVFICFIIY